MVVATLLCVFLVRICFPFRRVLSPTRPTAIVVALVYFFFFFFSLLCTYFLSHPVFYYTYASESCTALARLHLTLCSPLT